MFRAIKSFLGSLFSAYCIAAVLWGLWCFVSSTVELFRKHPADNHL